MSAFALLLNYYCVSLAACMEVRKRARVEHKYDYNTTSGIQGLQAGRVRSTFRLDTSLQTPLPPTIDYEATANWTLNSKSWMITTLRHLLNHDFTESVSITIYQFFIVVRYFVTIWATYFISPVSSHRPSRRTQEFIPWSLLIILPDTYFTKDECIFTQPF